MATSHDPLLPATASLCAPAVRVVAVSAFAERSEDPKPRYEAFAEFHSVLALVAVPDRDGGTLFDGLVVHPDPTWGLMRAGLAFEDVNSAHELAACPWPPDEDEDRLAEVVDRVKGNAVRKAFRYDRTTPEAPESAGLEAGQPLRRALAASGLK
jgi:hypothetical protein